MEHKTIHLPIIAYDAHHHLHKGPSTSAENPDRVTVIVEHLKNIAEKVDWHVTENNVEECKWTDQIQRNCSACTFLLDIGSNVCSMCETVATESWNYV